VIEKSVVKAIDNAIDTKLIETKRPLVYSHFPYCRFFKEHRELREPRDLERYAVNVADHARISTRMWEQASTRKKRDGAEEELRSMTSPELRRPILGET